MESHHHHHDHEQHQPGHETDEAALAELLDLDAEVLHSYLSGVIDWVGELAGQPRRILDLGTGTGTGDFTTGAIDITPFLDTSKNPAATPYAQTPVPPSQPNMKNPRTAKAVPASADKVPAGPLPDLTKIKTPKKK